LIDRYNNQENNLINSIYNFYWE